MIHLHHVRPQRERGPEISILCSASQFGANLEGVFRMRT